MSTADKEYVAFISYRHQPLDMAVARKIHTLIEKYHVPKALRRNGGSRLGVAFRDQEELPVSEDLSFDICNALDHSAFFIVVCTPDTPKSHWVNREIEYFLQHHSHGRVLAILASGSPERSFPHALTHTGGAEDALVEPLAANICAPSREKSLRLLKKESIRLFAAMLGCPYDALVRREQRRRQKRRAAALLAAFVLLAGYAGILLRSNLLIEAKNRELEQLNQSLREQKKSLQLSESMYLTKDAEAAAADDPVKAVEYALNALPKADDDRPYYAPAESALISALGVYGQNTAFVHPRHLDVSLNAPARLLRVTEDGKTVIVLDEYDGISSYDPYTGKLNWQLSLPGARSSAYLLWNGCADIALDEANGLIYALLDYELFAIRLSEGTVAWQTGLKYSFDQFTWSDAGDTIVCLQRKEAGAYSVYRVDLVALDARTGREKQRVSFDRTFAEGNPYRIGRKTDTPRQNTVFSKDGKRLCGTLYEKAEGETILHYYVYDLERNEAAIVYSEPEPSYDETLWMGLSGEGESCLTVVKKNYEKSRWLNVSRIDLISGTLLHEEDAKPEKDPDTNPWEKSYAAMRWREDLLLASAGDQLYLISLADGTVTRQGGMKARVVSLYRIDDAFFGCVLSDGTCEVGWRSGSGGFGSSRMFGASFQLSAPAAAVPGCAGFIRPVTEESSVKGFLLGGYAEGFGYLALLEEADRQRMQIVRLAVIERLVEQKTLQTDVNAVKALDASATDGLPLLLNPDGTILFAWKKEKEESAYSYDYSWQLYDPNADEPLESRVYGKSGFSSAWPTMDGRKLILHSSDGSVTRYDFLSGREEELGPKIEVTLAQVKSFGEDVHYMAYKTKAESARRPDGAVLTAYCDGDSLSLWMDGDLLDTLPLPPELTAWSVIHSLSIDAVLKTGENGLVLLSDYGQRADDYAVKSFVLYDVQQKTWVSVEDAAHGNSKRIIALGAEQACFAVCDQDAAIHLYRLPGSVETLRTGIASESITDCRFLCGDRFLALCSKEGALEIYDTETASRVYAGHFDTGIYSCGRLSASMDRENSRLFVIEHKNHCCICLDTGSWTKLAKIANVYGYDAEQNRLYRVSLGVMRVQPAPSLDELIEMGQQVLAQ